MAKKADEQMGEIRGTVGAVRRKVVLVALVNGKEN